MVLGHGARALRERAEKTNYRRTGGALADCGSYRTTDGNAGAKAQTICNGGSNSEAFADSLRVTSANR